MDSSPPVKEDGTDRCAQDCKFKNEALINGVSPRNSESNGQAIEFPYEDGCEGPRRQQQANEISKVLLKCQYYITLFPFFNSNKLL